MATGTERRRSALPVCHVRLAATPHGGRTEVGLGGRAVNFTRLLERTAERMCGGTLTNAASEAPWQPVWEAPR